MASTRPRMWADEPMGSKIPSALNILLGLWLIVAPFVVGPIGLRLWVDSIAVGLVVAVLATIRVFSVEGLPDLSWVNLLLGIWMIISPFAFAGNGTATWVYVVSGIIIAALSLWSVMAARGARMAGPGAQPISR